MSAPFVWYELMTTDPVAAARFYSDVVGWKAQDSGMPGLHYTLLKVGEREVAGLMDMPPEASAHGAKPHWAGYVGVADVDAQAQQIQAAGGQQHKAPTDIPGIGRFAIVAAPDGAVFGLFKGNSNEMPPALPPATPGTVGWHELHAADGAKAFEFFSAQFGWTKDQALDMGPVGVYQLVKAGSENANGGMLSKMPQMPHPTWLYYVNVEAIDAAIARIEAGGGKLINGPMQVPGGSWIINAIDPQGAMFALVAPQR